MEQQLNLEGIIGNVVDYQPEVIPEVEAKEMIGTFKGKITQADIKTGTSTKNGKDWACVNLRLECQDEGLTGRLAFISLFLGAEPSLYGDPDKSQTEIFLDTLETAGLKFEGKSVTEFEQSVKSLIGQEAFYKSWHKKKKVDGKMVPQINESGYKVLAQRLIAPIDDSVKNTAEAEVAWSDV